MNLSDRIRNILADIPDSQFEDIADLLEFACELGRAGEGNADWWFNYWSARLVLRGLCMGSIKSNPESHPDRKSMDFKDISRDVTPDMRTIDNPYYNKAECPVCGKFSMDKDTKFCVYCFFKDVPGLEGREFNDGTERGWTGDII